AGAFAEAAMAAIELLVKAIVLALAWILFILNLLDIIITWAILAASFTLINRILPGLLSVYCFGVEYSHGTFSFKFEASVIWYQDTIFDLTLPATRTELYYNGALLAWEETRLLSGGESESPNDPSFLHEQAAPGGTVSSSAMQSQVLPAQAGSGLILSNLVISPGETIRYGSAVSISIDVVDDVSVEKVILEARGHVYDMVLTGINTWQLNFVPSDIGQHDFLITARDSDGIQAIETGSFSIQLEDDQKQQVHESMSNGAALSFGVGGVFMSILGIINLIKTIEQRKFLKIIAIGMGIVNIIVSTWLIVSNFQHNDPTPDKSIEGELYDAGYVAGIVLSSLVVMATFFIVARVISKGQVKGWGDPKQLDLFNLVAGGIAFGGLAMVLKIWQLTTSDLSRIMQANYWLIPLILFLGTATFAAISGIASREDASRATIFKIFGFTFLLISMIALVGYLIGSFQYTNEILSSFS
ncbi:MAG: hypothetical protein Q6365_021980, partial [Candidatus Sigynarchaeota archaeon]